MTTKKPGRGVDRKGRSKKGGKFVRLGDGLLTSEAWRSLSGSAVRYYIELRHRYNGSNNGELHFSLDEARKLLGMARDTALKAQRELQEKGFIRVAKLGGFHQRLATEYALTDEPAPAAAPTHDYRNWRPKEKSSVQKLDPTRSRNPTDNVIPMAASVQKLDR